jgi:hypothetical protein
MVQNWEFQYHDQTAGLHYKDNKIHVDTENLSKTFRQNGGAVTATFLSLSIPT